MKDNVGWLCLHGFAVHVDFYSRRRPDSRTFERFAGAGYPWAATTMKLPMDKEIVHSSSWY